MNTQLALETTDLNAYFGSHRAIHKINLQFHPKTVTALIGPSGCGKSTFLRCLNRLHEEIPDARLEGSVRLFGNEIYDKKVDAVEVRQKVGIVFQKPIPFPGLSIEENVAAGLKLSGQYSKTELRDRVESSLREAALWNEVKDKLNSSALSLSGGQQQRLCIARALAVKPEILLMDEPTSALDPISTAKVEELIDELKKSVTIILVTHHLKQAARVSDFTAFFLKGEVIEAERTSHIFSRPSKLETERYVSEVLVESGFGRT